MNVRQLFALVTVVAVGTVAFLPRTAGLARLELKAAVLGAASLGDATQANPAVTAHPERFDLQLGAAGDDVSKLRAVAQRFPDQPAAHAAAAIALTRTITLDRRLEGYTLAGKTPPTDGLDAMVTACAAGMRLESDNAFFWLMGAVASLEAGRDDVAREGLSQAAAAERWEEHVADMVRARWARGEAAQGGLTGLSKTAISAAALYPHYAPLRNAARVFLAKAIEREAAGDIAGGVAIRRDLLAVGMKMRRDSSVLIGNLVGNAICSLATTRPGGAPPIPPSKGGDAEALRVQRERTAQWERWTKTTGHPELAAAAAESYAFQKATRGLFAAAQGNNPSDPSQLVRECLVLGAGLVLLATAMWSVLLGGVFHALRHAPRLRAGEPMPRAATLGLWLGAAEAVLVPLALALSGSEGQVWVAMLSCGAPLLLLTLALLRNEASVGVTLARIAAGAVSVVGAVTLAGWVSVGSATTFTGAGEAQSQAVGVIAIGGALALTVPLLFIAALSIVGKVRGVPASVQVVRSFPRLAVPLASVALIGWAAHLFPLAAFEERLQDAIAQTLTHEGRALARWAGREWPAE